MQSQNETLSSILEDIVSRLPGEELVGQISEECSELTQAAQKLRRVWVGTTDKPESQALLDLAEESADVLVCIWAFERAGMLDSECVGKIMRYKANRWRERLDGQREDCD